MTTTFAIVGDDLTREDTRALLTLHLQGMHAASPPGTVYALDLSGLQDPRVSVWTVRENDRVIGIGALKDLGVGGEVKSMRTHPNHLRRGVAAHLLKFMIDEARARGWTRLSLETGTGPAFEPALHLYRRRGFKNGAVFSDYIASDFNQFLHLAL
jgi:putative acetyltransferase